MTDVEEAVKVMVLVTVSSLGGTLSPISSSYPLRGQTDTSGVPGSAVDNVFLRPP